MENISITEKVSKTRNVTVISADILLLIAVNISVKSQLSQWTFTDSLHVLIQGDNGVNMSGVKTRSEFKYDKIIVENNHYKLTLLALTGTL